MATTNRLYSWKDGEKLFVNINGATIEAKSLTFDQETVTLQFDARGAALCPSAESGEAHGIHVVDPLQDECLW